MWFNDYFIISMQGAKSRKKLTKLQNDVIFITTFMRLFNDAINRYKFTGLPDTVNQRVLLESLCVYGNATFFDENNSLLCLPSVPSGKGYNMYGDPTSSWVFSRNGLFNKEIDLFIEGGVNATILEKGTGGLTSNKPKKGVMVWETYSRFPFINNTIYYSQVIGDTLRTIDVDRKWLKRPFIPVCEESLVPSVTKMFDSMSNNDEFIPVSTGVLDITKFDLKAVDISPEIVKSATELVEWYENKYRELCGVYANTQQDKKGENLISDEIHANDDYTDKTNDTMIECLQHYLDIVNEQFGTSIKVERVVERSVQENEQNISRYNQ